MHKTLIAVCSFTLSLISINAFANSHKQDSTENLVSQDEIQICVETVIEMTKGHSNKNAVHLCQQGKLDEAIELALTNFG